MHICLSLSKISFVSLSSFLLVRSRRFSSKISIYLTLVPSSMPWFYSLYDVHEPNDCFFHDTFRKTGQEIEKTKIRIHIERAWGRLLLHQKTDILPFTEPVRGFCCWFLFIIISKQEHKSNSISILQELPICFLKHIMKYRKEI